MTDSEKMDLILLKMQDMQSGMQGMQSDLRDMRSDMRGMQSEIQGVKSEIQGVKSEMQSMQTEIQGMQTEIQGMQSDIRGIKVELQDIKVRLSKVEDKVTEISLHLENHTDRNIRLIAENFGELTDKLNQAIPAAYKNLSYEVKVDYLALEVKKFERLLQEAGLVKPAPSTT